MEQVRSLIQAAFETNHIFAENENYLLRKVFETDREDYLNLYRAKTVWQELFANPATNAAENLWNAFIHPKNFHTIIIRKADGQFCGFCGMQNITEQEIPELSIELAESCKRQGIGTQVLPMLMKRYAEATGQRTFFSKVSYDNVPSQNLMRKLGGVPAGIAPYPDITEKEVAFFESVSPCFDEETMNQLAGEFGTTPKKIQSHALVFRFTI